MIDAGNFLDLPKGVLLFVLRALWWLGWDFLIEGIGWRIGWVFYRILTLGKFPTRGFNEVDEAPWVVAVFVDISGLIVVGGLIALLTNEWPT